MNTQKNKKWVEGGFYGALVSFIFALFLMTLGNDDYVIRFFPLMLLIGFPLAMLGQEVLGAMIGLAANIAFYFVLGALINQIPIKRYKIGVIVLLLMYVVVVLSQMDWEKSKKNIMLLSREYTVEDCKNMDEEIDKSKCYADIMNEHPGLIEICDNINPSYHQSELYRCAMNIGSYAGTSKSCTAFENRTTKEQCLLGVAVSSQTVSICSTLKDIHTRNLCFNLVAKKLRDASYCGYIDYFAPKRYINITGCVLAIEPHKDFNCSDRISDPLSCDLSICSYFTNDALQANCLMYAAIDRNDSGYCDYVSNPDYQSKCFAEMKNK